MAWPGTLAVVHSYLAHKTGTEIFFCGGSQKLFSLLLKAKRPYLYLLFALLNLARRFIHICKYSSVSFSIPCVSI